MSVCVVDNNNTMTTSASSTELNDTNCASTPSSKAGIPAIPKRPTIIRVDKQNVQENTDESKSREVPKVPPRPPPPRPSPPPVPTKQPLVPKSSESDKKKKRPEITIVSARPMSEVCFRDKKPEIPVPPRPQKPKDQGEVSSSVPSSNCTNAALSTESQKQIPHSTTDIPSKSSSSPPERPPPPPAAAITKKDPPKIPPQRPAPLKSTLSAPIESSPPPRPPACASLVNSQPHSDQTDSSSHIQKEQSITSNSIGGSVTPPKPRPRTFIDTSSKPLKAQRTTSCYKPTKNEIPPRPLPRKQSTASTIDSDVSRTNSAELISEATPPPKPSRHQSFCNSSSPIPPSSRPCSSPPSESQEPSPESDPSATQSLPSTEVSAADEEVLIGISAAGEEVLIKDSVADEEVLIKDSVADEEVLIKDSVADEEVLIKDSVADEEVLIKDSVADEEVLIEVSAADEEVLIGVSATDKEVFCEVSAANEEVLDPTILLPAAEEVTATDETDPRPTTPTPSSESTETPPESFNVENESSSSTDTTTPCPLPPKKNSLVISQPSFKCSSEGNAPVPSPRIKRPPKPDVPVKPDTSSSKPVNSDPTPIISEEPKDFILPSTNEIVAAPAPTANKPTIIRASKSIEILQESNLSASSEKLPTEETTKNEERRSYRPPPPIPKKNPISANVCDRDVPNGNNSKPVPRPAIPKKPPKPSPPAVAQIPVKHKQSLPEEPETRVEGGSSRSSSSSGGRSIKNFFVSKKSSSPSSSSTDLKKSPSAKSRKASEMLQTTKDYTRRITKSLGFTQAPAAAEEPSTVWYTDQPDEPEEATPTSSLDKKKETPSIWYVDPDAEEKEEEEVEAPKVDSEKDPVPTKPTLQTEKDQSPEKLKTEIDDNVCQLKEEPSPTEVSAFQKYHSYMKRTIEEAVGMMQSGKSTSSLMDDVINEEKKEKESEVMKPQPVKPAVPPPPKQRPPIPPKDVRPPKPSAPPQIKPNVPAVPPKRPPVPPPAIKPSTKLEAPAVRPPPPRPKPVVSVKPTVPNNQNTINDSDLNSKNEIKSEKRSSSIENLIGKFEEELCKKSVPPPRPAQPVSKSKIVSDNQEQPKNKETTDLVDTKTEITSVQSKISDGSKAQPDENENLSVSATTEVGKKTTTTTTNLTADSSTDENANEEADGEPGKVLQDANSVSNVDVDLTTESVTESESSGKVVQTESFNKRCKSLMNDLKTRFENEQKDDKIEEVSELPDNVDKQERDVKIEEVGKSLGQLDISPEKMQDSSSNEEIEEKVEPPSSEDKSSSHFSLGSTDTKDVLEKSSQNDSTRQPELNKECDIKSSVTSVEVTTLVTEQLDSKESDPKEPFKSSSTSEFTGPRAIASFDFDAQAEDELTLKKDDKVKLLSWVDTSWLYGTCHGITGIFPLAFVHIIEPLPQTPSDTNGNIDITDLSLESAMEDDATHKVSNDSTTIQVMDKAYQKLSEVRIASLPESMKETESSTKQVEISGGVSQEDELNDSEEQLDKMNIPVGGEKTIAYALYDFDGEDGELSFKEGDAITILKWVNDDWLFGKKEEMVGNLPANFVNFTGDDSTGELEHVDTDGPPMPKEPPPSLQPPDVKTDQLLTYVAAQLEHVKRLKGFACARFDFEARDEDELSFKDGDRIEILEFVSNDWIRGSLHKREGIFPAAFVSVEEYSPDEEKNCPSEATKVRALHEFTASASDELSFKAGALIMCNGEVPNLPGWSHGSFEGKTGMFPTDFVTKEGV